MFFTPKWWLSHAFVLVMLVTMASAGVWQLNRLAERRASNADIAAAAAADPVPIEDVLARIDDGEVVSEHTVVVVRGEYRSDLEFLVANRTFDTQPGSWLAAPVELEDGTLVVVSRGWIPRRWIVGDDPRNADAPSGTVEVVGRLFNSVEGGLVATGTTLFPEVSRLDLDAVSLATGAAELAPRWVQLDAQVPAQGELPIPVPPEPINDGPHLSYAVQWFIFTTSTVIVYSLILRKRYQEAQVRATNGDVDIEVVV